MKTIIRKAKRNSDGTIDQDYLDKTRIRCPICGKLLQRPGNAKDHECFRSSQDELQSIHSQMVWQWTGRVKRKKTELHELSPVDMRRF